ncbi:MAG: DUF1796 family putative cysteine peptidase [Parachlamydiaceae bacterium]|nr:DUF1796 family putative cysteine peptidase [Parachlamydiaceae bacterium]
MRLFKIAYLFVAFLCFQTTGYCQIHFISLGRDCEVAFNLRQFNLRRNPYPFDWLASDNFSGIMLAINDDLQYLLNPNLLIHKGFYIENILYQFKYNHFFPIVGKPLTEEVFESGQIVPNFLKFLPYVKSIQNIRIENFFKTLSSVNDKIIFIRTHATPNESEEFVQLIKKKYPNLDFHLVVVHERTDLIGNWNIPHVINFYTTTKKAIFPGWWHSSEWNNIFNHIINLFNNDNQKSDPNES